MTTTTDDAIVQKTRELCQVILEQPAFQSMRLRIDQFLVNDEAKAQYEKVSEKGEFLQHKQQQNLPLSGEEINDFEQHRAALFNNPIARGFLDAQEEMHKLQETVQRHVSKTFELGRVPEPADLDSGSCGTGCGCH